MAAAAGATKHVGMTPAASIPLIGCAGVASGFAKPMAPARRSAKPIRDGGQIPW